MTTNKKWKSHTKIKNNVLTVLRSFNQLDTHFSYIILSNGFPPSNTRHQLNNHKHNTHPHTHLPGQRCIDAAHRHCTTNPNDECCSDTAGSKAVTLLVNSSGKRSHCTYCQFCVLPCTRVFVLTAICRVELYVMLSVEFFCVQWRSMAYWILVCWFRFILNVNYSTPSYIWTRKNTEKFLPT